MASPSWVGFPPRGQHPHARRRRGPAPVWIDPATTRRMSGQCAANPVEVDPSRGRSRRAGRSRRCGSIRHSLASGRSASCGAVVEAEQVQQAEHDVGVGAGVGDDDLGAAAAVLAVEQVDQVQRVARGAGHAPAGRSDGLVVDHVQPGRAAPAGRSTSGWAGRGSCGPGRRTACRRPRRPAHRPTPGPGRCRPGQSISTPLAAA